jgi:hypothetical protein
MFRELITLLRGGDPPGALSEKLKEMIRRSGLMFETAWEEAAAGRAGTQVRDGSR